MRLLSPFLCVRVCVCLATRATTSENHKQTSKDIYGGQATTVVYREWENGREVKKRKLITQRYERKYTQAHTPAHTLACTHTRLHSHLGNRNNSASFVLPQHLLHSHIDRHCCVTYTPCCTGDNGPTWAHHATLSFLFPLSPNAAQSPL